MTKDEKDRVVELRGQGKSYKDISTLLGVSVNTISSFCRRANVDDIGKSIKNISTCKNCGRTIKIKVGCKPRQYCSDVCRMEWWNSHLDQVNRKAMQTFTCSCCGKEFESYGKRQRYYCSHACYISGRYGREVPVNE